MAIAVSAGAVTGTMLFDRAKFLSADDRLDQQLISDTIDEAKRLASIDPLIEEPAEDWLNADWVPNQETNAIRETIQARSSLMFSAKPPPLRKALLSRHSALMPLGKCSDKRAAA